MTCDARSCHCRVRDGGSAIGMARGERMKRVGPVFFLLSFLLAACSEEDKQFLLTYDHPKPIQVASAVSLPDRATNETDSPAPAEMTAVPAAPVTVTSEPTRTQATAPIVEAAPGGTIEAAAASPLPGPQVSAAESTASASTVPAPVPVAGAPIAKTVSEPPAIPSSAQTGVTTHATVPATPIVPTDTFTQPAPLSVAP